MLLVGLAHNALDQVPLILTDDRQLAYVDRPQILPLQRSRVLDVDADDRNPELRSARVRPGICKVTPSNLCSMLPGGHL